jgi:hypothetical protein
MSANLDKTDIANFGTLFTENGLLGIKNELGEVIVNPIYDTITCKNLCLEMKQFDDEYVKTTYRTINGHASLCTEKNYDGLFAQS